MSLGNRRLFEGLQQHGLLSILTGHFVAGKLRRTFLVFHTIKVQDVLIPECMKHYTSF